MMLGAVLLFIFLLCPLNSISTLGEGVECPSGSIIVDDTCYFTSKETLTWDEAEEVKNMYVVV